MKQLYLSLAYNPINVVRERIKCTDLALGVAPKDAKTQACQQRLAARRSALVGRLAVLSNS